ncbi:MAG: hypothetical protein JO075_07245 [Acidimicrobiia bacterium]|nr:hypothetical protein [Acidimicrobiia bacterium]
MVLVAFVLVLLAAATFAAGIAASRTSDTLVYLSILFSLAAFVVLAIASLRARQARHEESDAASIGPIDETELDAGSLAEGRAEDRVQTARAEAAPAWRPRTGLVWDDTYLVDRDEESEESEDEALDAQLEDEEDEADYEVPVEPLVAAGGPDHRWRGDAGRRHDDALEPTQAHSTMLEEFGEFDEFDFEGESVLDVPEEPVAEPEPELEEAEPEDAEPEDAEPEEAEPEEAAEGSFFDDYDGLTAAEILPVLGTLNPSGLRWVRGRERSGANRVTVLNQVEKLIADTGGSAPRPAPRKRAPATKAAPARRAAKKSTKRR